MKSWEWPRDQMDAPTRVRGKPARGEQLFAWRGLGTLLTSRKSCKGGALKVETISTLSTDDVDIFRLRLFS